MVQAITRPATYEDLKAVPDHLVAEILFGDLVTHPRPAPRHAIAATRLNAILSPPFDLRIEGPGGWVFMVEPELHLGEHVAVPDLAGWRRETLPSLPDTAWIETPPDWVCEVLSPATEKYDRDEKRLIYAESGIPYLWLVDPRTQVLEAFEFTRGRWMLLGTFTDNKNVSVAPFDAITFSLGMLWPFDTPPTSDADTKSS